MQRSSASFAAAPNPTHSAGDNVPDRNPCSWPPPWIKGRGLGALAHPQRANTLRAVDLVRRHGDEVGTVAKLDAAERLDGVGQHQRAGRMDHFGNGGDRLPDADLIVHHHHRNEQHAAVELARKQVEIEASVMTDRKQGEVDAVARQPLAGVEHRGMFGGDGDDAVAALLRRPSRRCPSAPS